MSDIFPLEHFPSLNAKWKDRLLNVEKLEISVSEKQITSKNWSVWFDKYKTDGIIRKNARSSSFADWFVVVKGG